MQREETGSQSALGGEPDAVARRAESLTHRGDESDAALRAVSKLEAGRGPGSGVFYGDKRKEVFDLLLDAQAWDDLLVRPDVVAVQRHELDEPHLIALAARELRELDDLVIVAVLHHHHVQLDGPQAPPFPRPHAVPPPPELCPSSDPLAAQEVSGLQPFAAFRGHAVDAAEVAAVGHRDPEVIRMAPVGVD